MRQDEGVQGCAGLCRVGFFIPTQIQIALCGACAVVCRVCRVVVRAGAYVHTFYDRCIDGRKFSDARRYKAYTPCTPYTVIFSLLIYIDFICVGFVQGRGDVVQGCFLGGF